MVEQVYKEIDHGVIPTKWEIGLLGDNINEMTDFVAAGSFESLRNNVKVSDNIGYAFYVRLVDIRAGLGHKNQKYVDEQSYKFLSKSNLHGNEVLMANIGANVGETFIMPKLGTPATIAPNMIVIRSNDNKLTYKFLYYYTKSNFGKNRLLDLIAGSGHPKICKTDLKKYIVLIPPSQEQFAITTMLSDVDALINSLDKLVNKKRDIKQAAMQELLTGKKRLPGFGGEWKNKKIAEIAPMQRGFDLPTTQIRRGIYPIVYSNGVLNYHAKYMVKGPGVVTGRSGTIGCVNYIEQNFWPHNTSLWVTDFKKNYPKFIYYLYTFIGFEKFGTGSGVPTLNRNDVHAHEVLIPQTSDEQIAITDALSDIDAEISALEQKCDKIKLLKQGMMQKLLTGRVRLV